MLPPLSNKAVFILCTVFAFMFLILFPRDTLDFYTYNLSLFIMIVTSIYICWNFLRQRSVVSILMKNNDADRFIEEIEKDIQNEKGFFGSRSMLYMHTVNMTAGLCEKGMFQKAVDELIKMDPKKIHIRVIKAAYFHNLLVCLYLSGKKEEARKIMQEQHMIWKYFARHSGARYAHRNMVCMFQLDDGLLNESEQGFAKILAEGVNPRQYQWSSYGMALALIAQNRKSEAKPYLEKIVAENKYWLGQEAARLLATI